MEKKVSFAAGPGNCAYDLVKAPVQDFGREAVKQ